MVAATRVCRRSKAGRNELQPGLSLMVWVSALLWKILDASVRHVPYKCSNILETG